MKKVYESVDPSELVIVTVSPDCDPIDLNGPLSIRICDPLPEKYANTREDPDTASVFVPSAVNVALIVSYLYATTPPPPALMPISPLGVIGIPLINYQEQLSLTSCV